MFDESSTIHQIWVFRCDSVFSLFLRKMFDITLTNVLNYNIYTTHSYGLDYEWFWMIIYKIDFMIHECERDVIELMKMRDDETWWNWWAVKYFTHFHSQYETQHERRVRQKKVKMERNSLEMEIVWERRKKIYALFHCCYQIVDNRFFTYISNPICSYASTAIKLAHLIFRFRVRQLPAATPSNG